MDFIAIDVETANADYSSICQIGIVEVQNGEIVDQWSTLVNPDAYFDPFNISIHGIKERDVEGAPTFDALYPELKNRISERITIHHSPFDKIAVNRACAEYDLKNIEAYWLDSVKIARNSWENLANKGYGLASIAQYLDIDFEHHDALEDAKAAAQIVLRAIDKTGYTVEDWFDIIPNSFSESNRQSTRWKRFEGLGKGIDGNPDGPLSGESLVFTGALFLPRKKAAKIASDLGCDIKTSVSKKTTLLVVGDQDMSLLAGYQKSSKHRKAEKLIGMGIPIKILSEKDFIEMCNNESADLQLTLPKPKNNDNQNNRIEESNSVTFENDLQDLDSNRFEKLKNLLENLTDEQKAAIEKSNQKYQNILDSIKKCTHAEKREFAKDFRLHIEKISQQLERFENETLDEDEAYVIDTLEMERNEIQIELFELMKNKISLSDFFEVIKVSIEAIESDIEEYAKSISIKNCGAQVLKELKIIESKILKA